MAPYRKVEPMDIMGALLRGEAPQVTTEENDIIERLAFYMRRLEHRSPATAPKESHGGWTRAKDATPKKKVTYYLTKTLIQHLEKAQQDLLEACNGEVKPRISKSVIVEVALQTALQELDAKGSKSCLFQMVHERCFKTREPKRASKTELGEKVK